MKESGIFRTKLFGGFNKKDVFEYFESLQQETKNTNLEIEEQNKKLLEETEIKNKKISELLDKIDVYSDKVIELENQITCLSNQNEYLSKSEEKNKDLEAALFQANKTICENENYKLKFDETNEKMLKIKSELILKDSQLQKYENKINSLKSIIASVSLIDDQSINSAKYLFNELEDINTSLEKLKSEAEK